MNEYNLSDILEEVHRREFAVFDNSPQHDFSYRHRRAMKKILSVKSERRGIRCLPPSKRIALIAVLIFLTLFTVTVGAAAINGFIRKEHRNNTQLFAANAENSPSIIEYEYYLPVIPDGYKLHTRNATPYSVCIIYMNSQDCTLTLKQEVKNGYNHHFDRERTHFEKVNINGHYGLYLDFGNDNSNDGILVWDNDDYVLEIDGVFAKNELINLAKSAKVL